MTKRHADDLLSPEFVAIRKSTSEEEHTEVQPETVISKVERGVRMQQTLAEAIGEYARTHGVSKSVAADKVLMSQTVTDYVALDKRMGALLQERHEAERVRKLGG
jgi:hypothetical protein